jgi:hypothetical protein
MKYYLLEFLSAPADEGEGFRYKTPVPCSHCGLKSVPYSAEFIAPEDRVEAVHL